ncbi:MAG: hypothetical protein GWM90_12675, partial [Gemmatimonadetes bacterium]|nr:hypothetical protein [Gemmatimonadota bacterium]NIQ54910.1 hypothetical protein [Gemmatimonadota bacterium]NIU75107.1 hypothetical protein [Gammaproteobacteria bacterium]NIX44938.1 hypothetical protein [Gemmatimonadota bacterium]NIY09171.1 hypothetical protein [Gemmatimonadota bacterium]
MSRPIPVYRASPRAGTDAEPDLVLNPRHAVAYGSTPPLVYVEVYGDTAVTLGVEDGEGAG